MEKKTLKGRLDYTAMIIPLLGVVLLCVLFMIMPAKSSYIIQMIRGFLGNDCGIYYAMLGVGIFACSLYIAFSKYGKIKLGKDTDKPIYSSFNWGVMIFTSTMAADILFYSLCEWALYANEKYIDQLGGIQKWASTFPLFHWGPIAWSFYIILAVAFGFMLHVRGRNKQKFSEGCRPLLGNKVDGVVGKIIDLIAIFALIAGTATTFSLATPLLSAALSRVFGLPNGVGLTIAVLLLIAAVYTFTVITGMKGISKLATYCSYLFFALLIYFLIGGGETTYILETGFSAIGNMVQNFIGLSTWMDPLRETSFPQNWTIYYWAQQMKHGIDISGMIAKSGDYSTVILKIFDTLPLASLGLLLLVITMIAFYSTTFDALTMVVSSYSYKKLDVDEEPDKKIRVFWAIIFILFPIALIFAENSMYSLQSVAIIAAFPIGFIILLIVISFFKDANKYLQEKKENNRDIE